MLGQLPQNKGPLFPHDSQYPHKCCPEQPKKKVNIWKCAALHGSRSVKENKNPNFLILISLVGLSMGKTNDYKVIRDSSRNCLHVCGLLQLLCACIDVKIHQKTDSGTCVLVFNTKGSLASFHCTQIIAVPKGIERTCMRNFYCTFHTNQNRI